MPRRRPPPRRRPSPPGRLRLRRPRHRPRRGGSSRFPPRARRPSLRCGPRACGTPGRERGRRRARGRTRA
ncbi:MAG: hypothetical protein D6729_03630 [Deltaproteobacteria bacterium]|nr:MAG: hypothetical protein D6729_03630 [Deltaproteobacteria bacterium]